MLTSKLRTVHRSLRKEEAMTTTHDKTRARVALVSLALMIVFAWSATALGQWTTNGTNISNSNTGNVGVGTTTPAYKLDIVTPSQWAARFRKTDATNGGIIIESAAGFNPNLAFSVNGTFKWYLNSNSSSSDSLQFWESTGTFPRFTLTQAGNLGLGTVTPTGLFTVASSAAASNTMALFDTANDTATTFPNLVFQRSRGSQTTRTAVMSGDRLGGFAFRGYGATNFNVNNDNAVIRAFAAENFTDTAMGTYMTFETTPSGTAVRTEKMRINANGNVGIGTANPGYTLDVNGNMNVQGGVTWFRQSSGLAGNEGAYIAIGANGNNEAALSLGVYRAGVYTNRFLVNNFGHVILQPNADLNVGIGTNTPGYRLDVQNGMVNAAGGLCIAGDCKTAWSQVGGSGSSQWTTSGTSIYYNTGNVGLGTTTPTYKLEVQSPSRYSMAAIGDGDSVGYAGITIGAKTTSGIASNRTTHFNLSMRKDSWFGGDTSGPSFVIEAVNNNVGGYVAPFIITSTNNVILNGGQGANTLSYGNVGIGTTAPVVKLAVGGPGANVYNTTLWTENNIHAQGNETLTQGGRARVRLGTAWNYAAVYADASSTGVNNDLMLGSSSGTIRVGPNVSAGAPMNLIVPNGNVGIGTPTPGAGYRLDVQGGSINTSGGLCIAGDCKTAWSQVGGGGSSQWTTSGTTIYYNGGNVGIGTSTPTALLDVRNSDGTFYAGFGYGTNKETFIRAGSASTGVLHVGDLNTTKTLLQEGSGNVGIGTATPNSQYKLDVAGNINSSGTITGNNIVAKYQDVAEWVPSSHAFSGGTVVVLDSSASNQVTASNKAYDTRVAGVVSLRPGLILGEAAKDRVLVATTGRVKVMVDASNGPIEIGDLLVTSDVPGVAMKSVPVEIGGVQIHRPGTLIGKALEPLPKGRAEILVLLSLQ